MSSATLHVGEGGCSVGDALDRAQESFPDWREEGVCCRALAEHWSIGPVGPYDFKSEEDCLPDITSGLLGTYEHPDYGDGYQADNMQYCPFCGVLSTLANNKALYRYRWLVTRINMARNRISQAFFLTSGPSTNYAHAVDFELVEACRAMGYEAAIGEGGY